MESVAHSTFLIERSFPVAPERVFAAFADPAKKRTWYAERGSLDVESFEMDFRVGGTDHGHFRMKEGTPFPGVALIAETTYQDIVPNQRIVFAYTMTIGERKVSASLVTIELLPTGAGTGMYFTEQGAFFEGADGPKMREEGQGKLLDLLAAELAK